MYAASARPEVHKEMRKKIVLTIVGLLGTEVVWEVWKFYISRRKIAKEIEEREKLIAEVLEFSEHSVRCRDHSITRVPCEKTDCPVANVSASSTLDVCMYVMTCDDLTNAVIGTHRRGVRVRVIIDSGMSDQPACNKQILRMRRSGIEVRMNRLQPSSLMHHKFALVDETIVIFGSTNWTMQAFYGNYDGIFITNVRKCVEPYLGQFEKMWHDFGENL